MVGVDIWDPSRERLFWLYSPCRKFYESYDWKGKGQNEINEEHLSLVRKIEKIIQKAGGKRLYEDVNFGFKSECGSIWLYSSLYKKGKDGIILIHFEAGHDKKDCDSIQVCLGRYQNNLGAYAEIVEKLERLEEKVTQAVIEDVKIDSQAPQSETGKHR